MAKKQAKKQAKKKRPPTRVIKKPASLAEAGGQ